ncbi:SDR family oxidoreductase [Panacibacter sp. DH6]|uniref:SDR family oxidoreductase n=2 Tax=Panacibacter microcysteis TaxID=2793269 RepID=A0A931MCK1_9BACT|nr:SDR family oxidoreductase [Panacibacter microcysteis]
MKDINTIPPQHQDVQPGIEAEMNPLPVYDDGRPGSKKLKDKVAIITGGDSGIGRAIAISFAKEGADVVIAYLDENNDAKKTAELVKGYGRKASLIAGDLSVEENCKKVVDQAIAEFGKIDVIINNAAVQYPQDDITGISAAQLHKTFAVNIYPHFYMVKYALPHLKEGSSIINTASVTAYKGKKVLLDYSSTKGAIVAFTRSLSQSLFDKKIRVNAVAPGPVWTPLIPASFDEDEVASFGKDTMYKRPAQPAEIAPCYVFLASDENLFMSGQVLHPNGGTIVDS